MSVQISRILHAGYVLQCNSIQILFDPLFENPFSKNCYAYPEVHFDLEKIKELTPAAVFISHYHDDHCSLESLNILNRDTPIYAYCIFDELFVLLRKLGFNQVVALALNKPVFVGPFEVIPRQALDVDVDSLLQIKVSKLNILNVVDSWIDSETLLLLKNEAPWDLILWPFQTMREIEVIAPQQALPAVQSLPPEWKSQLQTLKPRYVVPSSCQFKFEPWSWYNDVYFPISYLQFNDDVQSAVPHCEVIRMNPGVSYTLDLFKFNLAKSLAWVIPVGLQDVDYHYVPNVIPPKTADIAKQFPKLSDVDSEQVFQYCKTDLLEKYKSLEVQFENFFYKPRFWQLLIYDNSGIETVFNYFVHKNNIELCAIAPEVISWSTEISIAKLYAALKLGESLTSLYIRINDRNFSSKFEKELEKEIESSDCLDDPLIRCLFTNVFLPYQHYQLNKIFNIK